MSDSWIAAWLERSEEERRSIVAALQALAEAHSKDIERTRGFSLSRDPVVDVFAARTQGRDLVAHYIYDFRLSCWTISGSDWDEHYFHIGEAVCRGGAVVSHTLASEMESISEYDNRTHDEREMRRKKRVQAVAAFWKEWMEVPFPFPGDPGPPTE